MGECREIKPDDPYELLGIERDASMAAIKGAYHRRALEAHPDKGGSAEVFRRISEAFELLTSPKARWLRQVVPRFKNSQAADSWVINVDPPEDLQYTSEEEEQKEGQETEIDEEETPAKKEPKEEQTEGPIAELGVGASTSSSTPAEDLRHTAGIVSFGSDSAVDCAGAASATASSSSSSLLATASSSSPLLVEANRRRRLSTKGGQFAAGKVAEDEQQQRQRPCIEPAASASASSSSQAQASRIRRRCRVKVQDASQISATGLSTLRARSPEVSVGEDSLDYSLCRRRFTTKARDIANTVPISAVNLRLRRLASNPGVRIRRRASKQSGVPNVVWKESKGGWELNGTGLVGKDFRTFWSVKKYQTGRRTLEQADKCALAAAKQYRKELVKKGVLRSASSLVMSKWQPEYHSHVVGVTWQPGNKRWLTSLNIHGQRLQRVFRAQQRHHSHPLEIEDIANARRLAEKQRLDWEKEYGMKTTLAEVQPKKMDQIIKRYSDYAGVCWDEWDECWNVNFYKYKHGINLSVHQRFRPEDNTENAIVNAMDEAIEYRRSLEQARDREMQRREKARERLPMLRLLHPRRRERIRVARQEKKDHKERCQETDFSCKQNQWLDLVSKKRRRKEMEDRYKRKIRRQGK